jgi:ABC-2 type transport system permease protein
MRELGLVGLVCVAFGVGAYTGTGEMGLVPVVDLAIGGLAWAIAAALLVARWGRLSRSAQRGPLIETALLLVALLWGSVLVERAAALSSVRFDWTFERRFELAPATLDALGRLPQPLRATLYHDANDPRTRRTHLLLEELARHGPVSVEQKLISEHPKEEDAYGIGSSDTVVLHLGDRWERIDRPSEGTLFEAISYLSVTKPRVVYALSGAGEGDLASTASVGYSGLATAFETEGYQLRRFASAAVSDIPADADAVLAIAPERALHPALLAALRRYLDHGGSLIAMLEPGLHSGLEDLLAHYGIKSPDAVIVDPDSGSVDEETPGLDPIAFNYSDSPVTRGLESNRRTFFRGARSFVLHKPRPDDQLQAVVYASGDSWLDPDLSVSRGRTLPARPAGARQDFHPIVVTGRYQRGGAETRIVAFGDSDFASNANLRSLYNLDLVMNAAHWSMRREPRITLRPKAGALIQFPVPIQNSLKAFYGVGLVIPQVLLIAGGLVWLRRRSA